MMGYGNGFEPFGMLGGIMGMIMHLAILVLVILLVVWAFKSLFSNRSNLSLNNTNVPWGTQEDRSISILNERFAKGEITEDEYVKMKSVLLKKE